MHSDNGWITLVFRVVIGILPIIIIIFFLNFIIIIIVVVIFAVTKCKSPPVKRASVKRFRMPYRVSKG